jgi:hypothetical protein
MKKNTALSGPLAVLMLPRSTKELLTFGKAVHDAMDGNPNFPSPNPPLSVFRANLTSLDDAETKAAGRGNGAVEARDALKRLVINDMYHLCDYVQGVAEKIPLPGRAARRPSRDRVHTCCAPGCSSPGDYSQVVSLLVQ